MKIADVLIIGSLVLGGCAGMTRVASNLTQPADPTAPSGPTVIEKGITGTVQGTPWEKYGPAGGALIAALLTFLKVRKVEGEVDEQWDRTLSKDRSGPKPA